MGESMLKRFTALLLCLSVVGMALSATGRSCCCKKGVGPANSQKGSTCCRPVNGTLCVMAGKSACCNATAIPMMGKKCRCLGDTNLVGLTSYTVQSNEVRGEVIPLAHVPHTSSNKSNVMAVRHALPLKLDPAITVLLCTYRC